MNKISKPILVSALVAVGFGAIGAGATFALFTDRAETTITAEAGKIDISSTLTTIKTYSAKADTNGTLVDENQAKYVYEEQASSEVQGVTRYYFVNGGYVTYEAGQSGDGTLSIHEMTPGDKVEFSFDIGNGSTVDFKYRMQYQVLNQNYALSDGLVTSIQRGQAQAEKFAGLRSYRTGWSLVQVANTMDAVSFVIELPIDKGNDYQDKTADIKISFEAVQGNAAVNDSASVVVSSVAPSSSSVAPSSSSVAPSSNP